LIDVQAVGVPVLGEHEDMANARLTFADGSVANVTASRVALKTERKLRLLSEGVYVTMDFHKKRGRLVRLADGVREKIRTGQIRPGILTPLQAMTRKLVKARALKVTREQEPLMLEDQEFLSAIAEAREPLVSGRHGLRAMEAASRVVASIDAHLRRLRESES
jgi:predicted dehydrogenase